MITLDQLNLGYDLVWSDRHQSSRVLQSVITTVGAGQRIFYQEKTVGRLVTLEATEDQGWISSDVVPQLKVLAATPGAVFTFNFHDLEVFQVMFRHQDQPALDLKPLITGAELGQWFIGTIKLFSV